MRGRGFGLIATRVGRRTLATFVLSAIVPTTVLAAFSYWEIRDALLDRTRARVESSAKEHAAGVVERAVSLRDYFTLVVEGSADGAPRDQSERIRQFGVDSTGDARMRAEAAARLEAGETALTLTSGPAPGIRLLRRTERPNGQSAIAWGDLSLPDILGFAPTDELDPMVCIVESTSRRVLQCSAGVTDGERAAARAHAFDAADGATIAASRSIFLTYEVGGGSWEAVAFRRRVDALAPVRNVERTFGLVVLLALLVVFSASHMQIRRITAPLERLSIATHAVRDGEYRTRVDVASDDEFGELAESFNAMSHQLAQNFDALAAVDAVDRVALSTRDIGAIVDIAQRHVLNSCGAVRVVVFTPSITTHGETWFIRELPAGATSPAVAREVPPPPSLDDVREECLRTGIGNRLSPEGIEDGRRLRWLCLPLRNQGATEGMMAVGSVHTIDRASPAGLEARRLGDRLAAALANVRLVRQLEAMGLGTLTAFARAVDTNSSWTAGHSERVTTMAVVLGERLGLTAGELDTLRRGGLLHDIGKIGVPAAILDKPGPLTDAEVEVLRQHPVLGHRILSPIGALRDVLPIVRSHHERVDGTGYPDRLRGDEIPRLARVLAVADVFDALTSDRPYRSGMPVHEALAIIRRSAGSHFDPDMVRHFLQLHAEGHLHVGHAPQESSDGPDVVSHRLTEQPA